MYPPYSWVLFLSFSFSFSFPFPFLSLYLIPTPTHIYIYIRQKAESKNNNSGSLKGKEVVSLSSFAKIHMQGDENYQVMTRIFILILIVIIFRMTYYFIYLILFLFFQMFSNALYLDCRKKGIHTLLIYDSGGFLKRFHLVSNQNEQVNASN